MKHAGGYLGLQVRGCGVEINRGGPAPGGPSPAPVNMRREPGLHDATATKMTHHNPTRAIRLPESQHTGRA